MSFGYLPLPLYLILMIVLSFFMFIYTIKVWNQEPKALLVGLFLLGISGLGGGANRLGEELQFFGDGLWLVKSFTFWVGVIGTILLIIGGLQRVKDDPYRKKLALIAVGILGVIIVLMAILVLYLYSRR